MVSTATGVVTGSAVGHIIGSAWPVASGWKPETCCFSGPRRSYHAPPADGAHLSLCEGFSQTLKQYKYSHGLSPCPKEPQAIHSHAHTNLTDSWIMTRL